MPARPPVAWGAALVSVAVMVMFCGVMWFVFTRPIQPEARDIIMALVGYVAGMATAAVNYWLGASRNTDLKALSDLTNTPNSQ